MVKHKIINDPVYNDFLNIDDPMVLDVIGHPYFQRLRHIKQLGFTFLVYPGAVHTRFSHMLGALNLMGRAVSVLRSKGVDISPDEALGVRLAILLHDIGHGPFSHTSERMLCNVHHETLTALFMERLNTELQRGLATAMAIFEDRYPRHFLHQLVSSQLDMDRLDYLGRDSFFTGVSEGIVGTERIINMLNVKDDTLVVEEKGIYSIEKFIISRRLMYWQVYLHKTVIAADTLFYNILDRARYILAQGGSLTGSNELLYFLSHEVTESDFRNDPQMLDRFASIDDNDVISTVKGWRNHSDAILRMLAANLIDRRLSAIRVDSQPFRDEDEISLKNRTQQLYGVGPDDARYFVCRGLLVNHAYRFDDTQIKVLYKNGECKEISTASDQLDRPFLEKTVTKYYLYFPKELK